MALRVLGFRVEGVGFWEWVSGFRVQGFPPAVLGINASQCKHDAVNWECFVAGAGVHVPKPENPNST